MMPRPRRYRDVRASIRRRDRDVGVSEFRAALHRAVKMKSQNASVYSKKYGLNYDTIRYDTIEELIAVEY